MYIFVFSTVPADGLDASVDTGHMNPGMTCFVSHIHIKDLMIWYGMLYHVQYISFCIYIYIDLYIYIWLIKGLRPGKESYKVALSIIGWVQA